MEGARDRSNHRMTGSEESLAVVGFITVSMEHGGEHGIRQKAPYFSLHPQGIKPPVGSKDQELWGVSFPKAPGEPQMKGSLGGRDPSHALAQPHQ